MVDKKLFLKIFIGTFALLVIIGFILCIVHIRKNNFKIKNNYEINTDPQYVRIYYDYATISSLYQVYDFLLQNPNSTNFLRWDRVPNLQKKFQNRKNTTVLQHFHSFDADYIDPKDIIKYYKTHPDAKFIIHSTHNWIVNLFPIINEIPKSAIKEVHIYEDGSYSSTFIKKGALFHNIDLYKFFHKNFEGIPVIFHMEDAEYLNSYRCLFDKQCLYIKNLHRNDIVVKSSINDLKEKLNSDKEIKDKYFKIFDFNYKKYEKIMIHPFGIYTFTFWSDYNSEKREIRFMYDVMHGKLNYLVKDKNVKWFYKEHPSNLQFHDFSETLSKTNPELIRIEKSIPLELFLIADIVPDYVAGYSSGVYLNYPKKSICAYINRPNDPYMYIIKRDKRFRPGRTFDINDVNNTLKSKLKRLRSRILVFFQ